MRHAKPLEQFEFHQTLAETRDVALVFFSSPNCSSCRYWEQLLDGYRHSHAGVHLFKIDAGRDQALTEEFGVYHLPALFLYYNGQYHSELQCEARIDTLEAAIATALKSPPQEMP